MNLVVCFLVINYISKLPHISISSVLEKTSADIKVGYLREQDVKDLPQDPRIELINLNPLLEDSSIEISFRKGAYIPFDREDFFDLVRLKWSLFSQILQQYDGLIYSDVDVIWLQDLHHAFVKSFSEDFELQALVQDASIFPDSTQLCMGLFACKSSNFTLKMIKESSRLHAEGRAYGTRYSDDNAITDFYIALPEKSKVKKLPQATFPVGNLFNLFLPVSLFRGLRPSKPFIFHANYVVGIRRKVVLLRFIDFIYNRSWSRFLMFIWEYVGAIGGFIFRAPRKMLRKRA